MTEQLLIIFALLFVIFFLVMLGEKIKISSPIILVLGGLFIGLMPGLPIITIGPDLIFTIFLPPLLFEAAWYTSWKDFWKNKRPIILLAFGLVFFTSVIVGLVSSALIPGFTFVLGCLLGGIISPPDAVAATSVLNRIPMPKRLVSILEGESLLNDASSLIVFRFALIAAISGSFILEDAIKDFFIVVTLGTLIGLGIAFLIALLLRYLPTSKEIDTSITIMAPYLMFLTAEHFEVSGVLAVVSGGLFLSYQSHRFLSHASRFQSSSVLESLGFILVGLVFILIGLQLPLIAGGLDESTMQQAIFYGVVISLVAILVRMVWIFVGLYISSAIKREKVYRKELWNSALVLGWSGMRGVVSLAAALNIPLYLNTGEPFPFRNMILFITFVVILFTLLIHGLTLPRLVKSLKLQEDNDVIPEQDQHDAINMRLINLAIVMLREDYAGQLDANPYLRRLFTVLEHRLDTTIKTLASEACDISEKHNQEEFRQVYKKILEHQRLELLSMRKENLYLDDKIREALDTLDLEEMQLAQGRQN